MAKTSYLGSNVETQDTFSGWLEQTNKIIYDMGSVVLTAAAVNEPNTTNGAWTSGNTNLQGTFGANTVAVFDNLRGGTVQQSGLLTISSNTTFSGSNTIINTNTAINGTNTVVSSNGVSFTGNTVLINLNSNGNTVIQSGDLYVNSNTVIQGGTANIHVTTVDVTGNSTFTATNFIVNADSIALGVDGTDALDVHATSDFNANVNIDGITTITANVAVTGALVDFANDVTIGSSPADTLIVNSEVESDFIPTANNTYNLGATGLQWDNIWVQDAKVSANVEISGKAVIKGSTARELVSQSTTTAYQDLKLTLRTTAGNEKNPVIANSTVVQLGSANASYQLGTDAQAVKKVFTKDLDVANSIVVDTRVSIGENLNVTGDTNLTGTFDVTGNSEFNDLVTIQGSSNFEIKNGSTTKFEVKGDTGNTDIQGTLDVGGQANVSSVMVRDLTAGQVTFAGTGGELSDKNTFVFTSANNTLKVTGNTVITTDLSVGDDVTIADALTVEGLVNFNSTVAAANSSTGAVVIDGGVSIAQDAYFGDDDTGIFIDAHKGIYLEGKKHGITYNDGNGNFNIRVGHQYTTEDVVTENGFVYHNRFTQNIGRVEQLISSIAKQEDDTDVVWFTQYSANSSGVYLSYQGNQKFETQSTGAKVTGTLNVVNNLDVGGTISADTIEAEQNLTLSTESTLILMDSDTSFSANADVIFNADARFAGTMTVDGDLNLSVNTSIINYLTVQDELRFGVGAVYADSLIPANTSINMGTYDNPFGDISAENFEIGGGTGGQIKYTRPGLNDATFKWNETVDAWQMYDGTTTYDVVGKIETTTNGGIVIGGGANTVVTVDHEIPPAGVVANTVINVTEAATFNGVVITGLDLDFDKFGHTVDATIQTHDLDSRYYTESESDTRFLNVSGDNMAGTLNMVQNTITNIKDAGVANSIYHVGDTNTYMQFNAADSWRVVTGGSERLRANTSHVSVNDNLVVTGNSIEISGASPHVYFKDTTASADDFYAHVNSNNFYILTDRGDDGTHETPNPLMLQNSDGTGYLYGNRLLTVADEGSGNGLDADTVDGVEAASLLRSDANDIKTSGYLRFNDNIKLNFGTGSDVQVFDNGSDLYMDMGAGHDLIIRDATSSNNTRFRFYTSNGNFTNDGTIVAGGAITSNTNQKVFADDYHPNADKLTTARTITLAGDASGNVSFDGSANKTLTVAVANDSHTHDGRYYTETEADTRFLRGNAADTMTGVLTISHTGNEMLVLNDTHVDGSPYIAFDQDGDRRGYVQFLGGTSNRMRIHNDVSGERLDIANGVDGLIYYAGNVEYKVWHAGNDGPGSGLNADTLDGVSSGSFIRSDAVDTVSANTEWQDNKQVQFGNSADSRFFHNNVNMYIDTHKGSVIFRNGANTSQYTSIISGGHGITTTGPVTATGDGTFKGDIYVGSNGGLDSRIFFYDDSGNTWRTFFWDQTADQFKIEASNGSTYKILTTLDEGAGNGIDADTLDGISSGSFIRSDANDTVSANTEWQDNKSVVFGNGADSHMYWSGSNWHHTQAVGSMYTRQTNSWYFQDSGASNVTRMTFNFNNGDITSTGTVTGNNLASTADATILNHVKVGNSGDSHVMFWDDNNSVYRSIFWDDSVNVFRLHDNAGTVRTLVHSGNFASYQSSDADTLDGISSGSFIRSDANDNVSANTEWQDSKQVQFGNSADVRMFFNGSHMYMDILNDKNFYIRDIASGGTATTRYTFDNSHGHLIITGDMTADAFLYTSDETLKENIEEIETPLQKVKNLRGVTFDWKDEEKKSDKKKMGLIAQEVEKVIPEVVHEDEEGIKKVEYGNVVALLIEAIKELEEEVRILKEKK